MAEQYIFNLEGDDLALKLMEKVVKFQDQMISTGIAGSWKTLKDFYENKFFTEFANQDILNSGEQGEELATAFNHFRNIIRHQLNPLQAYDPEFTVTAVNSDIDSIKGADLGKQIIDYYTKVKRLSKIDDDVMEYGAVYGQGFHVEEWNPELGKQTIKNGRYAKEGDFDVEAVSVWDCFYDYLRKGKKDWYIFRRRKNKFDIAQAFDGQKREEILALKPFYTLDKYYKDIMFTYQHQDSDDIYIYSAYHRATPSVPEGRYVLFAGEGDKAIHLYDSFNIYKDGLPVFELKPSRYLETGIGFTDALCLRAPQMLLNNAVSVMSTNIQNAVKSIWTATGEEVTVEELASGRNLIQSRQKPEVLDLYTGDAAVQSFVQFCVQTMETLSAQNAVVRGNVASAPNLKSGIAIQTVIAMGQQYGQSLEKAKKELFEDVNTFRLEVLKMTADTPRLIDIVGKSNTASVIEFTKKEISNVSKVVVQEVNPISKSYGGRIEMAFELLKIGKINLSQYFTMIHTGNIDVATDSDKAMINYIYQVKSKLLDGVQVTPVSGVDHVSVIKEVQALLLNLDFTLDQKNQAIVQNITQFLTASMELNRNGDQITQLIYGGQAPQPNLPTAPMQPGKEQQLPPNALQVIQGMK